MLKWLDVWHYLMQVTWKRLDNIFQLFLVNERKGLPEHWSQQTACCDLLYPNKLIRMNELTPRKHLTKSMTRKRELDSTAYKKIKIASKFGWISIMDNCWLLTLSQFKRSGLLFGVDGFGATYITRGSLASLLTMTTMKLLLVVRKHVSAFADCLS